MGFYMVGEAIRLLRIFHNIKQGEMAKALDIHTSFLSEIETGKRKPSLELIAKYAEHFSIRPSAILFFSEELDKKGTKGAMKEKIRELMLAFLKSVEAYGTNSKASMPSKQIKKLKDTPRNSRGVSV